MELGILISAVVGHTLLAYIVLSNNPRSYTSKAFAILNASSAAWSVATYMSVQTGSADMTLLWMRLTMFFAAPQAVFFFLTVTAFPNEKTPISEKLYYGLLTLLAITMTATLSPFVFTSLKDIAGDLQPVVGPGMLLFVITAVGSVLTGGIVLIVKYVRAQNILRAQLRSLIVGLGITFLLIVVFNFLFVVVLNNSNFVTFGPLFTFPFLIAATYAITRHGMFNTKVIVSEVTVAALVIVNIGQLFTATDTRDIIFRSVTLLLVMVLGYLLVRSVQNEVRRREEVEKLAKEKIEALGELELRNKNLATLQMISDIVLNESDTRAMTQKIMDELPKQLGSCVGGLLSIAKEGKLTAYAITRNNLTQKVIAMIGGSLEKYSFPIKKEYNRIHEALVDKKSIDSDSLTDFISPPIPKAVAASIQTLIGAKHVEVFPLYAGGEPLGVMLFVFNRPGAEVHDKNYAIAKAISDDLSLAIQRAQAFEQLKAANEYLAELDKMKDEFISMASHELNTPLAAIEGYLSMVLDEGMGKIDKQSRTYLSRAYASSKRLAELILDLLNVSRIEQGRLKLKYELAAISEMIESVKNELQIKADGKKIYLKAQIAQDLPKIWCDPNRIREVIVNLTGNALKFTDKGGVTVMASQPDAKTIRVAVTDTGRGIAKADQSKLFQKFSQVKREVDEHQGTGLGLYISKNFVELHHGKIWVDSDAGKGATFSFELPLIKEPPKDVDRAMLEASRPIIPVELAIQPRSLSGSEESVKQTP